MEQEKKMTEQESLLIIQQMIQTAKQEQKDDGKGWILWGWLLFTASVLTYINLKTQWFSNYFFWNVFGIASLLLLLFSVVRTFFFKKIDKVKTYTAELFQKLNIGFFISLLLIIVAINRGVSPVLGFSLLLGLYGFWILIYGAGLNFKPSIIGAYITWACAFAGLFVETFGWTMVLHATAVLLGYIIPGHLANIEFKKIHELKK
ncbi:MAG TPA: hypothetical protein VGQ04_05360 [Chitinophagaceae bacterium]|jgi:hypothetical protein|nr:hypothetical protein [Chitinophagaceae bacterium]